VSQAGATVPGRAIRLVGETDESLTALLRDVLHDLDVGVDVGGAGGRSPLLVLAIVNRADVAHALADARADAGGTPIVAVLPFADEDLARRSLSRGASACFSLDTPLGSLRELIVRLLEERGELG
jgi:hypothetical protein